MHASAHLVTIAERAPGVLLHLLHTEADASALRIHSQHFHVDNITGINNLAGVLDAFRPTHFRNMDQTFHAWLEFHKRTVVSNAGDSSIHPSVEGETFFDALPR